MLLGEDKLASRRERSNGAVAGRALEFFLVPADCGRPPVARTLKPNFTPASHLRPKASVALADKTLIAVKQRLGRESIHLG